MLRNRGFQPLKRLLSTQNTTRPPPKHSTRTFLLYGSGIVGSLLLYDNLQNESTGWRTLKAFYTLSLIGIDYGLNFKESTDIGRLHERNADRLFNLLNGNKGLYIKFGQNIANQSTIFPKAFQDKFSKLYDSAATDPWEKIDDTLRSELGDYEQLFESIDKKPIASASIAQVHKAKLKSGEEVALKVQHHYISKQINADLITYKLFMRVYEYFFEVPVSFSADYIAQHMKEEVDFTIELSNAERVRKLITEDGDLKGKVHIPLNYEALSGKRVLISEWCVGDSLIRFDDLQKKYNTKKIMNDYLTLFSKMIFEWGFVHSDPHPGNLLVRYQDKKQQLVLLDHGLYVEFSEGLRHEYCNLWKSLFELNDKELKKIARKWGIGDDQSDMFASFSLLKPYHKMTENLAKMSKFEKEQFMKENFKNFFKETEHFPLELIFLGRTMRMVQLLNQRYRAPVNRINLFTKEAVKGYYLNRPKEKTNIWSRLGNFTRYGIFLAIMTVSDITFYVSRFSQMVFGTRSIEDLLQDEIAKQMKALGADNPDNLDIFSG